MNKDPLRFYSRKLVDGSSDEDDINPRLWRNGSSPPCAGGDIKRFATTTPKSTEESNTIIYCQLVEGLIEHFQEYEKARLELNEYKKIYRNKKLDENTKKSIRALKKDRDGSRLNIDTTIGGIEYYAKLFAQVSCKEYNECLIAATYNDEERRWNLSYKR